MTEPENCVIKCAGCGGEVWHVCSDCDRTFPADLATMTIRAKYLEDALQQISEGRGRFSRDPLTHASNTIDDMMAIAVGALAGTWAAPTTETAPK